MSQTAPEVEPRELRAARALLGWSEAKLAQMSKVSLDAVRRIEREQDLGAATGARAAVRHALEAAGIVFIGVGESAAGGLGLRLKR